MWQPGNPIVKNVTKLDGENLLDHEIPKALVNEPKESIWKYLLVTIIIAIVAYSVLSRWQYYVDIQANLTWINPHFVHRYYQKILKLAS